MRGRRRPGWEAEFYAAVDAAASGRFHYGVNDCCLWVASLIGICTGRDPGLKFRGQYQSKAEAMRIVSERGGIKQLVTDELGLQPVPIMRASRGDPVLLRRCDSEFLGIIEGGRAVFLTDKGITRVDLDRCHCAWATAWRR